MLVSRRLLSSSRTCRDKYSFTISEAYHAKKRSPQKSSNLNREVSRSLSKHRPNSGEDSFFYTTITAKAPRGMAFGVADGVGGWSSMGVDPSAFSQALCDEMESTFSEFVTSNPAASTTLPSPQALLQKAYSNIVEEGKIEAGGSTACVGIVSTSTGTLHTANLGDSGFSIYRSGKTVFQSKAQTHAFNTPYQLAILPPALRAFEDKQPAGASRHILDYPSDADIKSFQLKHGDLVVFSTDGFLDNISSTEALAIVTKALLRHKAWDNHPNSGISPSLDVTLSTTAAGSLASQLVKAAHSAAHNSNKVTPFAKEVQREMRIPYKGGKPDDITILALYVTEKPKPAVQPVS